MSCHIARGIMAFAVGILISISPSLDASSGPARLSKGDAPKFMPAGEDEVLHVADSKAPVEIVQERYPNGRIKISREVTRDSVGNYILHGQWKMWDATGKEIASGQYRNNRRHGKWFRTHAPESAELFSRMPYKEFKGPFTSTAFFNDGQLHGKWTIVDSENRQISEWGYAEGVRHGLSSWQYVSGKKMREITYRDGFMEGKHHAWSKDSKLVVDETYQWGSELAPKVEYYESGRKKREAMYLHAQFVIDAADNWWNAKPVKYRALGDDQLHGRWTSWHANGQKKSEGMYDHGIRDGQFAWWYENSQQAATGSYKQGQSHGVWEWWHENGQKSASGQYVESDLTGQWYHWRNDGQLRQKADYSGSPDSIVESHGGSDAKASRPQMSKSSGGPTLVR